MRAQPERKPGRANWNPGAKVSSLALDRLPRLRSRVQETWLPLQAWLQANTAASAWLPARWRRPLVGYLVAALAQLMVAGLTLLPAHLPLMFALQGALVTLVVILVALMWGAGPSLLATLVGTALLDLVLLPSYFDWLLSGADETICSVAFLLIGFSISLVAGQTGRVRQTEELVRSLRQEQARSDIERQRLQTLLDVLPAAVGLRDSQSIPIQANQAYKTLWGGEVAQVIAARASQKPVGWWPDSGKPIAPGEWPIDRAFASGEITSDQEIEIEDLEGKRKVILASAAPIRDKVGATIGGFCIGLDITERRALERRTQEALSALLTLAEALVWIPEEASTNGEKAAPAESPVIQHLAELIRNVLGCARVGLTIVDRETNRPQLVAAVGMSPEEVRYWQSIVQSAPTEGYLSWQELANIHVGKVALIDASAMERRHFAYQSNDYIVAPMRVGERLVGLLSLSHAAPEHEYTPNELALAGAVAKLVALVVERERLLNEREAARANALALREANRQMDTFMGMASHELRTPLATMKLSMQLIQRRLEPWNSSEQEEQSGMPTLQELLAPAERQVWRLERLVKDLLDVSRIKAGKLNLLREQADLGTIVSEAIAEQRQLTPEYTIDLQMPAHRRILAEIDVDRIKQVVVNYLTNALKYSPPTAPVVVGLEDEGRQARVWVRDQGPGLPAEEQQHIWEGFHQARGIVAQDGKEGGLGLGLHICRFIIEHHQGQVGVQSAPGKGSTFWFTVPHLMSHSVGLPAFLA